MRVLTVQQPWAWAIFHGKDVENRTQLWKYRGPVAIHAGARLSERGCAMLPDLLDATSPEDVLWQYAMTDLTYGAILGTVDLVDVHHAEPAIPNDSGSGLWARACCDSPWAEQSYVEHGGRERRQIVHLVLEDAREFATPIPNVRGRLGLWTPDAELLDAIGAAV